MNKYEASPHEVLPCDSRILRGNEWAKSIGAGDKPHFQRQGSPIQNVSNENYLVPNLKFQ